jgi:hypothetical protein
MIDLQQYPELSVTFVHIDPVKDCVGSQRTDGDEHLSFDRRFLEAVLEKKSDPIRKGSKVIENVPETVRYPIALESIGDCVLALYWQDEEQRSRNPVPSEESERPVQRIRRPLKGEDQ